MKDLGFRIADCELSDRYRASRPAAFTMIEVMIVIAIIVLALALAVPAFNFITGSRSIDGAQNVVSAMLGRARAYAIANETTAGVAFYLSPVTGRTTMALVASTSASTAGAGDVTAWTNASYQGPTSGVPALTNTTYAQKDTVSAMTTDSGQGGASSSSTKFIQNTPKRIAHEDTVIVPGYTVVPVQTGSPPSYPPAQPTGSDSTWSLSTQSAVSGSAGSTGDVDIVADTDTQTLPPGVGLQLINDAKDSLDPSRPNHDRYVRTGVILFDPEGRLLSTPFKITQGSAWAGLLGGLSVAQVPDPNTGAIIYSQLGIVLYDQQTFINQEGDSEGDPIFYQLPGALGRPSPAYTGSTEVAEEQWLDQNGLALFVNRYNGSLSKSE